MNIKFNTGISYFSNNSLNKDKKETLVSDNKSAQYKSNPISKEAAGAFKQYAISFEAKKKVLQEDDDFDVKDYIFENINSDGRDMLERATSVAKQTGSKEVTSAHVLYVAVTDVIRDLDTFESGDQQLENYIAGGLAPAIIERFGNEVLTDYEKRYKLKNVLVKELDNIENFINNLPKSKNNKRDIEISEDYLQDVESFFQNVLIGNPGARIDSATLVYAIMNSLTDKKFTTDVLLKLDRNLAKAIWLDDIKDINSVHIPFYDDKAKNVWKNLSIGTNMMVISDASTNPDFILKSLYKTFEDPSNDFGKINPETTDITLINEDADLSFWLETVNNLKKDKSKTHVIVVKNLGKTVYNSVSEELRIQNNIKESTPLSMTLDIAKSLTNVPSNIKFVVLSNKDYYYAMQDSSNESMRVFFRNFGEANIPIINTSQAKLIFKETPGLLKDVKKGFTPAAINKCITESARLSGNYPEKTLELMDKIASYYIDKEREITPFDVDKYLKEAGDIFGSTDDNSSIILKFDTGKRLKDIVGKESTKKEALAIVKQIRSGKIGTKGFIVFSQDGSVGSGRRHTVQAIAGETQIPYAEINTMDFATKEVNLFDGVIQSPEGSIKKLFSIIKAQAESNPKKAAILFIENFEYFAVGELVSEYHQKAMAQLLREMDKAQQQGLNIIVMGSVSNPKYIGDSMAKSFKFIDHLEITSPSINTDERFSIIKHIINKNNMKIAGSSQEEKDNIIKYAADISVYFPFIQIQNLVKKAQSVAFEQGHRVINKSDITEAYLQITTGRPSIRNIAPEEKEIVTSHECGHATNLTVMNNLAKNKGKHWHIPDKVNFVTLDPRGYYGGAVYHGNDGNSEYSFENNFANIVCSYGGHSAEKLFYDMDGSYGISSDLENATSMAESMVSIMGQGHNTGKISLAGMEISPEFQSDVEKDMRRILKNALTVSDLITEQYSDFNRQFTQKYSQRVGRGDCIVDGDTFRKELNQWRQSQSKEKQEELDLLDDMIIDIINSTKRGRVY